MKASERQEFESWWNPRLRLTLPVDQIQFYDGIMLANKTTKVYILKAVGSGWKLNEMGRLATARRTFSLHWLTAGFSFRCVTECLRLWMELYCQESCLKKLFLLFSFLKYKNSVSLNLSGGAEQVLQSHNFDFLVILRFFSFRSISQVFRWRLLLSSSR